MRQHTLLCLPSRNRYLCIYATSYQLCSGRIYQHYCWRFRSLQVLRWYGLTPIRFNFEISIFNRFFSFLRLSQPAQLLIDFTISDEIDAESVKYDTHPGDLLVLNLQETELSKRNYVNDVPNVECCFTSLLHIRYGNWSADYWYFDVFFNYNILS